MMTAIPTINQAHKSLAISGPPCLQRSGKANTRKVSQDAKSPISTANLLFPSLVSGTKPIESFKSTVENYAEVSTAAAFVRDQPRPGPVMVLETPLIDLLSGREQAIPIHGFIWGWVLRRKHEQSAEMLNAAPPPFVFVGSRYEELVRLRTPGLIELLATRYREPRQSSLGRWYALADSSVSLAVGSPDGWTEGNPDPIAELLATTYIGRKSALRA